MHRFTIMMQLMYHVMPFIMYYDLGLFSRILQNMCKQNYKRFYIFYTWLHNYKPNATLVSMLKINMYVLWHSVHELLLWKLTLSLVTTVKIWEDTFLSISLCTFGSVVWTGINIECLWKSYPIRSVFLCTVFLFIIYIWKH